MATYEVDSRSKGNRYNQLTAHDQTTIHNIVNECPILHVSFNAPQEDGIPSFPTILPMLGAIGQSPNSSEPHLYLHGSSVARLFKLTNNGELPLCICATLLDGYVLCLAPFHNNCNYRCAILFGYGSLVTDKDEVLYAMELITNNIFPHRWENSRMPPRESEITSTGILKMRIETASSKCHTGQATDEKFDLKNEELVNKTWTGVVPVYQTLAEPVPNEANRVKVLPEYLADWVADANSLSEQRAIDALDEKGET